METEPVRSIEFEVTIDDLVEVNVRNAMRTPAMRRQALQARLLVAGGFILAVVTSTYLIGRQITSLTIAFAVGVAIVIFLVYPLTLRRSLTKTVRHYFEESREADVGPRRLEIEDDGLRQRGGGSSSLLKWGDLGPVEESGDYVYIREGDSGGHIIPKARVREPELLAPFVAEVRARVSS